jgi:hypothetical protein
MSYHGVVWHAVLASPPDTVLLPPSASAAWTPSTAETGSHIPYLEAPPCHLEHSPSALLAAGGPRARRGLPSAIALNKLCCGHRHQGLPPMRPLPSSYAPELRLLLHSHRDDRTSSPRLGSFYLSASPRCCRPRRFSMKRSLCSLEGASLVSLQWERLSSSRLRRCCTFIRALKGPMGSVKALCSE